ncbi:hypothetical protein BGZ97_010070 [Linnemannia gamsii]|uniref:Uncharacterized protein n=1 Tax=Linnemannia gamsii TaxID=64522 RepID=A0A9P6R8V8_9FUNG|nr:hypothetical protein BGZ97_010070 [Linnemannia gamsii]
MPYHDNIFGGLPPMQCQRCEENFPPHGLMRPLPVPVRRGGEIHGDFLCLECRRREFDIHKEPYPGFETVIVPRITEQESESQYCLKGYNLTNIPCIVVNSVPTVGEVYPIKLYEEKHVVDLARWVYGGEIGIENARTFQSMISGRVIMPPVHGVRERRNLIRQVFADRGLFADLDLVFVKEFVEYNQGNLKKIVHLYAD